MGINKSIVNLYQVLEISFTATHPNFLVKMTNNPPLHVMQPLIISSPYVINTQTVTTLHHYLK